MTDSLLTTTAAVLAFFLGSEVSNDGDNSLVLSGVIGHTVDHESASLKIELLDCAEDGRELVVDAKRVGREAAMQPVMHVDRVLKTDDSANFVTYSSRLPHNGSHGEDGFNWTKPCFLTGGNAFNAFTAAAHSFTGAGIRECMVDDPPLHCFSDPLRIKSCLDRMPAGRKAIHLQGGERISHAIVTQYTLPLFQCYSQAGYLPFRLTLQLDVLLRLHCRNMAVWQTLCLQPQTMRRMGRLGPEAAGWMHVVGGQLASDRVAALRRLVRKVQSHRRRA